jgi:integrase/recombinase XerD
MKDGDNMRIKSLDWVMLTRWFYAITAVRKPVFSAYSRTPHIIEWTAMHMLQAGVDITLIALWLGHDSPATTHMYVEADLAMKERALSAVQAPAVKQARYQPSDRVLHFLETL